MHVHVCKRVWCESVYVTHQCRAFCSSTQNHTIVFLQGSTEEIHDALLIQTKAPLLLSYLTPLWPLSQAAIRLHRRCIYSLIHRKHYDRCSDTLIDSVWWNIMTFRREQQCYFLRDDYNNNLSSVTYSHVILNLYSLFCGTQN